MMKIRPLPNGKVELTITIRAETYVIELTYPELKAVRDLTDTLLKKLVT